MIKGYRFYKDGIKFEREDGADLFLPADLNSFDIGEREKNTFLSLIEAIAKYDMEAASIWDSFKVPHAAYRVEAIG